MSPDTNTNLPVILVVDDDRSMRLLVAESLQSVGFKVTEAEDGATALAAFQQLQPDLVILDVNMPKMDGFAVCAAIRAMRQGNVTPVLMVTARNDIPSINRAYEVGATDFITKPINWAVLGHRVRYILRASQAFEDVRKNQANLSKAQRIARLGNWDWDAQKDRLDWFGEIYHTFGIREKGSDSLQAFIQYVHPDERERVQTACEAALAGNAPLDIEHRVIMPDGGSALRAPTG